MKGLSKIYLLFIVSIITLVAALVSACAGASVVWYSVRYTATEGGYVEGETEQIITHGDDAETVRAVPHEGFVFVEWSDGVTTPERQDENVAADMSVRAQFERITKKCTVTYVPIGGGTIQGKTVQTVLKHGTAEEVVAVPDFGYRFVGWSDGLTTLERRDSGIFMDITFRAIFEKITFTVRYECVGDMMVLTTEDGKKYGGVCAEIQVGYGDDCPKVVSIRPWSDRFVFVGWEDGVETEERQERNVTSDITIRAKVGYQLTYTVASGKGSIVGDTCQRVALEEYSEPVRAIADEGYVFSGWSDMTMDVTHKLNDLMEESQEYVVYFEPIEKTFRYDYGMTTPLDTEITLNRNALNDATFVIPQREGYTFRGWYAEKEYKTKVVHESGKLMLGLQTLNLETDALYARWDKIGEEKKTYKILMVMVDEIYATLYSEKVEKNILLDYKMTGVERKLCSVIPPKISQYLNEWFEGRVIFEIDTYFTREVIGEDSFVSSRPSFGGTCYSLYAATDFEKKIVEVEDIINEYECNITTHSLDDYAALLHPTSTAGAAMAKHAMVYMEAHTVQNFPNQLIIEETINYNGNGQSENYMGYTTTETYIHEFIHTIEMRYEPSSDPEFEQYTEEVYDFHKCFKPENVMEGNKQYLLKQFLKDGEYVGIPTSYWDKFYN